MFAQFLAPLGWVPRFPRLHQRVRCGFSRSSPRPFRGVRDEFGGAINTLLNVMYGLLAMALIIA
ncbi:hypothetical protein ACWDU9_33170, partial [Streptomyces cellulosae]